MNRVLLRYLFFFLISPTKLNEAVHLTVFVPSMIIKKIKAYCSRASSFSHGPWRFDFS